MLVSALKDRFSRYFSDPSHDTILWFDPRRDYRELLDPLKAAGVPLRLVEKEGDLIRVRYELQYRQPGTRTVVYITWERENRASDWLVPIEPLADIFTDSLFHFLADCGVEFPDDPNVKRAIRDVLPRLARQSLDKGEGYWGHVLASLDAVREELLGDFGETLLRFLASPQQVRDELRDKKIDNFFFGLLSGRYGFEANGEEEPAAIARRFTAQLIAVRAYMTTGKPDDFPFFRLLPAPHLLDECDRFLSRWQDSTFRVAYVKLANQIQPNYSLTGWLANLPLKTGLAVGSTFANVESALWDRVKATLAGLQTDSDWLAFINEYRGLFVERAKTFWSREGQADQWHIAAQAADLLLAVESVEREVNTLSTAEAVIQRYAARDGWWHVDRRYREFREAVGNAVGSYDVLHKRVGRAYHQFLETVNTRFSELVASRQKWEFHGLLSQDTLWDERVHIQSGRRVAVIFVDALRLELAHALADRLLRDIDAADIVLDSCVAQIATVTAVGMASLMPEANKRRVDYTDDWQVIIGTSGNLAAKSEREAFIRSKYPSVQIYSQLSEFLNLPIDQIPATPNLYVTFHTALDNVGENAQELALTTLSELIKQVEQTIRRFREAKVDEIYIFTDHGFLLVDDVSEADKAPVRDVPALKKAARYLLGRRLGHTDQLRFPIHGSDGLEGWFPRGIGCFKTPGKYNYTHGGLSLQEIVIPCLAVKQQVAGVPISVEMNAPAEIWSKLEKVKIRPVASQLFDRPRMVELVLDKQGQTIIKLSQVIEPGHDIEIKVLLPDETPLEIGDKVTWRLLDAITSQSLCEQPAVNKVDFF